MDKEDIKDVAVVSGVVGGIVFLCLIVIFVVPIVAMILNGYILSIMWGWFIVPVFEVKELSIAYAIGISITVAMLTHKPTDFQRKFLQDSEVKKLSEEEKKK